MAVRRSASGFRSRSQRRKTAWTTGPDATALSFTGAASQGWTTGVAATVPGLTITRVRGYAEVLLTVSSVADGGFNGAFGLGVTTLSAFNAGIASLPTPITDIDWNGWMVHQMFSLHTVTATIADGVNEVTSRFEIDSKSMRKLPVDEMILFGAIEVEQELGAATLLFHANTRMLVLLP